MLNNYFTLIPEVTGSSEVTSLGVVSMVIAFGGGILSFLSPCILPLVPIWLGYMAGTVAGGSSSGSTQPALAGSD